VVLRLPNVGLGDFPTVDDILFFVAVRFVLPQGLTKINPGTRKKVGPFRLGLASGETSKMLDEFRAESRDY
jgi:hypothetical protein